MGGSAKGNEETPYQIRPVVRQTKLAPAGAAQPVPQTLTGLQEDKRRGASLEAERSGRVRG
jgi:hypothetical protein